MRRSMLVLAALALFAGQVQRAQAGIVYTNGPIDGTIDAWAVSSGFAVTNSFDVTSSTNLLTAQVGLWVNPGDQPTSLDWSVGTSDFGTDVRAGSATLQTQYLFTNGFGADVYLATFALSGSLSAGTTYWLTLSDGVSV
jgi:hypothetical protein